MSATVEFVSQATVTNGLSVNVGVGNAAQSGMQLISVYQQQGAQPSCPGFSLLVDRLTGTGGLVFSLLGRMYSPGDSWNRTVSWAAVNMHCFVMEHALTGLAGQNIGNSSAGVPTGNQGLPAAGTTKSITLAAGAGDAAKTSAFEWAPDAAGRAGNMGMVRVSWPGLAIIYSQCYANQSAFGGVNWSSGAGSHGDASLTTIIGSFSSVSAPQGTNGMAFAGFISVAAPGFGFGADPFEVA